MTDANINFGDVVDSTKPASQAELDRRQYGFSEVSYEGSPTVYKTGDVVYLPYQITELSSMEAVGLAWEAYSQDLLPQ